jgi:hypothetical protein
MTTAQPPVDARFMASHENPSRAAGEPEQADEGAVAHEARTIPSPPDKVKLTLTVF